MRGASRGVEQTMYALWQHSYNTDAWMCMHYHDYDTTHVTQMPEHVYIMKTLM